MSDTMRPSAPSVGEPMDEDAEWLVQYRVIPEGCADGLWIHLILTSRALPRFEDLIRQASTSKRCRLEVKKRVLPRCTEPMLACICPQHGYTGSPLFCSHCGHLAVDPIQDAAEIAKLKQAGGMK